jgi:hypothetical protein
MIRAARFAWWAATHPVTFGRTATRAAKLLPTVRHAIPRWIWPILGLAALVKCLPLDFGADETLFAVALVLIAITRPGLIPALWAEASAGKPAFCRCGPCAARWAAKRARRARLVMLTRPWAWPAFASPKS